MARAERLRRAMPGAVLTVALAVLTAYAVMATGQHVQKLDLNDSGIWASGNEQLAFTRLLKSASAQDVRLAATKEPQAGEVDILQDGMAVLGVFSGTLSPIDPVAATADADGAVTPVAGAHIDMRGGTVAALDPASGKLWAARIEPAARSIDLSALDPSAKPLAEIQAAPGGVSPDQAASLSVGADGSIHAVSASGRAVRVPVVKAALGEPEYRTLAPSGLKSVQVAALASRSVTLDAASGLLFLPDGRSVPVPVDPEARLQQGGADADTVVVATATSLISVNTGDGSVTSLIPNGAGGTPAQPVQLMLGKSPSQGSCAYGAWFGDAGTVARVCTGQTSADVHQIDRGRSADLAFRVNWNQLVLNDRKDGWIYDVDLARRVDDWPSLKDDKDVDQQEQSNTRRPQDQKPTANNDEYGARPGRTSVLHVLDNDSDPNGRVLSITKVESAPNGAEVSIAPDGQTLLYRQPQDGRSGSFSYTIDNDAHTATATVTITARNSEDNREPKLREHATEDLQFAVASGGSVTMPVATDYRDFDGDPITVVDASSSDKDDQVSVTSDGQIEFAVVKDTKKTQTREVTFHLTDGASDPVEGTAKVAVLGSEDTKGIAPLAQADAARGPVNKPITIAPLANDIAGADPDRVGKLTLNGEVAGWKGARVSTDPESGRITVVAPQPGTHFLSYTAAFGSAPTAKGTIRVDVLKDAKEQPLAMPDQAVIRGNQPITVDVLANDTDPRGGLLTVQQASANRDDLQVAVVKGRWLRIVPQVDQLKPNPQALTYTVTNGQESVEGSVIVTWLEALVEDQPLVRDDFATVRAGDSTLIPVLANDSTRGGAALSLDNDVDDAPAVGQLSAVDDAGDQVGSAYVVGNQVRYVAPEAVVKEMEVTLTYYALADGQSPTPGKATVTVKPEPDDAGGNSPPVPESIEARATAGDTITIPIRASGQDPDGDSITVLGLATAPQRGRVIDLTPRGITYQAFPTDDSIGTDTFEFTVADRYGLTGTGTVRVAVVPPGQTQIPVPVDDTLRARPGATVRVDALANDLIALSDEVKIKPLRPAKGVDAELEGDLGRGPIRASAPGNGSSISINYQIKGNGGDSPQGTVTITGEDGYLNPPRLHDQLATTTDGKTATVDLLTDAWDPDSDGGLEVTRVSDPNATLAGSVVTVPVTAHPQVLSYEVKDGDGATSAAMVHVPAAADGLPFAKGLIELTQGKPLPIDLADFVESPRGRSVTLVPSEGSVTTSPKAHLSAHSTSSTRVELVAEGYNGPGTLNLQVTDATGPDDPDPRTAVVAIPVQVGPPTPVVRCPDDEQTITLGTTGKSMNLVGLCHVWTPNPADRAGLTFTATWNSDLPNVTPTVDGQTLSLRASGNAKADAKADLVIAIPGTTASDTLTVRVKDAKLPTFKAPPTLEVKQGDEARGTIELDSPIEVDRRDRIVSMSTERGAGQPVLDGGAGWSVKTDPAFHGLIAYRLRLSDVANNPGREIDGILKISVYGKPATPDAPIGGRGTLNHAVTLSWKKPDGHGAPILRYRVRSDVPGSDGKQEWPCASHTSCTIGPLRNNVPIRFQVQAINKAGESEFGPLSEAFTPDQVPSAVTGFTATNPDDKRITLSWNPVSGDFSSVTHYSISWPGGGISKVRGTQTVARVSANVRTTFSIWAWNGAGKSKRAARVTGWPTGKPGAFSISSVAATNPNSDQTAVKVGWSRADANGEGPVTYSLTRDGSAVGGCQKVTDTSCTDSGVTLDGSRHSYQVTAQNTNVMYQTQTPSKAFDAVGVPSRPSAPQAQATGSGDGEVRVSGTGPDSRGKTASINIYADNTKVRTLTGLNPRSPDFTNVTVDAGSNGSTYRLSFEVCNENGCGARSPASGQVMPYGLISGLSIRDDGNSGTRVYYVVAVNPNGPGVDVSVNGQHIASVGAGNSVWSNRFEYDTGGYNRTVDLQVTATDGSRTASDSASATSGPPPRSVSIRKGGSAQGQPGCSSASCAWVLVTTSGFSGSYTCTWWGGHGGDWVSRTYTSNVSDAAYAYYGYSGTDVRVTCDGVPSNTINW